MRQQVNLYRVEDSERSRTGGGHGWLVLTGLVVLFLCLGLLAWSQHREAAETLAEAERLEARQLKLTEELESLRARLAQRETDPALAARVRDLERERAWKQRLFSAPPAGLGEAEPSFAEILEGLARSTVDGLWLSEIEIRTAGRDLAFAGGTVLGKTVPIFVDGLHSQPVFAGREFSRISIKRPTVGELRTELEERTGRTVQKRGDEDDDAYAQDANLRFRIASSGIEPPEAD